MTNPSPGLPHPVRRVIPRKSRSSLNCAQNKNSSQHSPSVMRVSKCNGIRAHTHASTRRLCRPCLCFFYNFFINIILFYYWVTNRDFIDLFCHPLRPDLSHPQTCFVTPSDRLCSSHIGLPITAEKDFSNGIINAADALLAIRVGMGL